MEKLAFVLAALTMCGIVIAKEQYVLKTPTAVDVVEGGKVVRTNVLQTGTIVQVVESDKKKPLTKEESELRIDSFLGFKFKSREYVSSPIAKKIKDGKYICRLEKPFCLFEFANLFCTTNGSLYGVELRMQKEPSVLSRWEEPAYIVQAGSDAVVVNTREKLVNWIRSMFKIRFEKSTSGSYEFQNSYCRICLYSFSTSELKLSVYDLDGLGIHKEEIVSMEKAKEEELRRRALAKNEFGRDCAEQFEFERAVKIEEFAGFKFGSVEPFIVVSNRFEKAQDEEQAKFENDEDNKRLKRKFRRQKFRWGRFDKQVLQEPLFDFKDVELTFNERHELSTLRFKVFYSKVSPRESLRLSRDGKFERENLLKKQKEIVEWFSKKYKITFKQEWKSYKFRSDANFIIIERCPSDDSLSLYVSCLNGIQ